MKQNQYVIIAILLMTSAFILAAYLYNSQQAQSQQQQITQHLDALVQPHSPSKGNPNAKVTLVEFVDPACETCRQFHPLVKELLEQYPNQIKVVIRYAPLHKGSDQMIRILEAARKQQQFWNVLDLMFETQPYWTSHHVAQPEVFWEYLEKFGFDVAALKKDMHSPEIERIIQQDLKDGQRLGATRTPTFFVNGKPLPSFGYEQLTTLVAQEIAANY